MPTASPSRSAERPRAGAGSSSAPTARARCAAPPPASHTRRRSYPQTALTLNLAPRAAARRHLDRIPHRERPIHAGAAARPAFEPGLRARSARAPPNSPRWTTPRLSAEIERRAHSLLGTMTVEPAAALSARDRDRAKPSRARPHRAGRRSGACACRRSARRASISACATPPRSPKSSPTRGGETRRRRARGAGALRRDSAAPTSTSRTIAVDLLNRSLLTDFLPAHGVRGLSLYLVDRIGPLRRALMREGVAPAASQPRLMRGEMV